MENLLGILIIAVNAIVDGADTLLSFIMNAGLLPEAGIGVVFALALGAAVYGGATDGILANVRRWHGNIDERFGCIDNLITIMDAHASTWPAPEAMRTQLNNSRTQLQALINKCRTSTASSADRTLRNTLLKSTVGYCLLQVKTWAYGLYSAGTMTADDVHLLGFMLPGETGGQHVRTKATDVKAEVKVSVISEDFIRAVIDQSAGENAAQVAHGWPSGVRYAVIVIISAEGKMEVCRHMTTRLHNDIRMPEGSHGKQFIIKASFLKHVNDEPRFGNEPTFSMPLTTEDLATVIDRRHHEDLEAQMREIERQRHEIERLQAELKAAKSGH
jgi:hypothetical protein